TAKISRSHNPGMVQGGQGTGLLVEPHDVLFGVLCLGNDHSFERNGFFVSRQIGATIHNAHSSLTQDTVDSVAFGNDVTLIGLGTNLPQVRGHVGGTGYGCGAWNCRWATVQVDGGGRQVLSGAFSSDGGFEWLKDRLVQVELGLLLVACGGPGLCWRGQINIIGKMRPGLVQVVRQDRKS